MTTRASLGVCVAAAAACAIASCAGTPRGEAVEPLDAAGAMTPSQTPAPVVLSVEAWEFSGAQGRIIRTRHYRIFTTERDPLLVGRLPGFLESALDHYRSALGPLPAPPIRLDTYMMDNRTQWRNLARRLAPDRAEQYERIQRGGFATGGVGVFYDIGLYDTLAIAAHEGWHQYIQRTFRDPLPVWLDEGIATFVEGHRWAGADAVFLPWANVERFDRLRADAAAGSLMSLEDLLSTRPQDQFGAPSGAPLTYYAQVWALVHFLNEGEGGAYRKPLRDLLSDAAAGRLRRTLSVRLGGRQGSPLLLRTGPSVFMAYFGEDLDEAGRQYERFIQAIVHPGARGPIVAGRSPLAPASEGGQ